MKKFAFLLVLALLLASVMPAYAVAPSDNKYVITNTTAISQATAVSTSIIAPNIARILKVTVTSALPKGATSTETVVGVYDATSSGAALNSALEGEVEGTTAATVEIKYERPLKVYNGITIIQGAYTVVVIEWEEHL